MRLVIPFLSGLALSLSFLMAQPVAAQDIPACALSGSVSVMIGGKPALRMADVANCPPELVEIIPGIEINGQPMVTIRSGKSADTTCTAAGDPGVIVGDKPAQGLGDVLCKTDP